MMRRFMDDLDNDVQESDEHDATSISTGGSSSGGSSSSQRSCRKRYGYDTCRSFVLVKVLGEHATVGFKRVYRISKERFQAIHHDIEVSGNTFFFNNRDVGVPPAACMLLPIQCLAFGVSPIAFANFYQVSPQLARQCCVEFDKAMRHLYVQEYIQMPTPEDLQQITTLHEHKHGFRGMLGSLDCMHTTWKNCPMAWKGSFQGKEKAPTMVQPQPQSLKQCVTRICGFGMRFTVLLTALMKMNKRKTWIGGINYAMQTNTVGCSKH
jgi:Plant transposon protein